jgi:hypothetical protein
MTDQWQVSPRWWRLDPRSQVEVQLGPTKTDLDDWRLDERVRIRDYRPCISIRKYRYAPPGWTPNVLYGPWNEYDLIPYRRADGYTFSAMTRIVDGEPIIEIHALTAPTLGIWHETEPPTEQAA